jgi:hypothetical protein
MVGITMALIWYSTESQPESRGLIGLIAGRPDPVASLNVWLICWTTRITTGVGRDRVTKARKVVVRSPKERRFTAETMPSRIPNTVPRMVPMITRRRLIGIRWAKIVLIDVMSLLVPVATPRSPRTIPPSQFA